VSNSFPTVTQPVFETQTAAAIAERIPEALHRSVFHDNAETFYRWSGKQSKAARAQAGRGEIVELNIREKHAVKKDEKLRRACVRSRPSRLCRWRP